MVSPVTRYVRIVIETVHDPVDWKNVAIAEIRAFGNLAEPLVADAADTACNSMGSWPFRVAVSNFCATDAKVRNLHDCGSMMDTFADCRTYDDGFKPIPAVKNDQVAKGLVKQTFQLYGITHTFEFVRATEGEWSLKRHTRRDAKGRPAAPVTEVLVEPDMNEQNDCWEKLGKVRPEFDYGQGDGDGGRNHGENEPHDHDE